MVGVCGFHRYGGGGSCEQPGRLGYLDDTALATQVGKRRYDGGPCDDLSLVRLMQETSADHTMTPHDFFSAPPGPLHHVTCSGVKGLSILPPRLPQLPCQTPFFFRSVVLLSASNVFVLELRAKQILG